MQESKIAEPKVKVFEFNYPSQSEDAINEWLRQNEGATIINMFFNSTTRLDYYGGQEPTVCNQWGEYVVTILYTLTESNKTK